ncbi:hypothetical protein G039_0325275 [Pseudomonas aeruginosa VRFPA01]|nr:hypothetical protein G039_0325275 [Pseudomonas aeruginosa VRFPA01]
MGRLPYLLSAGGGGLVVAAAVRLAVVGRGQLFAVVLVSAVQLVLFQFFFAHGQPLGAAKAG